MLSRSTRVCFAYFGLAFYSQGVIAALQSASGDVARTFAGETNLSSTIAQSVILAGLLVLVLRTPRAYLRLCRPVLPLLCVVAFALCSVLWSADPARTMRRAVALGECVLFGLFLYRTDGLDRTIGRVGQVCVVMALLSLLAYVALPGIGRETALGYEQAMRGVFPQKNTMSECMLLGLCCYAYQLIEARRASYFAAVAVLALCLGLGRGASALAVAGLMLVLVTWMGLRGRPVLRLGLAFLVTWATMALLAALIAGPGSLFAAAGRDASLTGRVPLWQAIIPEILRSPWIGYGYAGFWNADSPTVQMIWRYAGWAAPDAHSSYLDILLQLGLAGFALYLWTWKRLFGFARAALRARAPQGRFVLLFGVTLLLLGLDEGPIPIPNAWTALLPVALLAMSRHRAIHPCAGRDGAGQFGGGASLQRTRLSGFTPVNREETGKPGVVGLAKRGLSASKHGGFSAIPT